MSALLRQIGAVDEVTFNTPLTVTHFDEFVDESIVATYARQRTNNRRPGQLYGSSRGVPYCEGAAGDLNMEVDSRGFGFWLKHMLGKVVSGTVVDGTYTHTFTPTEAEFNARSFTFQAGRPFYASGTVQPFTYSGGKVTSWELSSSVEENLKAKLSLDFASEDTATALAVASYPASLETLSWVDANLTIAGTQVDVTELTISGDNAVKTDRRYLRRSTAKKAQIRDGEASGEFSFTADFEDLATRNRVSAATNAGVLATLVATWRGKVLIGATTYPQLQITLNASLDTFEANASGPEGIMQKITGAYLDTNAITITYTTLDATV